MTTYSYAQLEGLWKQAGGSASLAPLMAAIALAESSGRSDATNPTDNNGTQTSWGLWQISDGTHNQPVPGILNPLTNAQQAVAKVKSQGLSAWGTYDSGAYRQFLQGSVPSVAVTTSGSTAGGTPGGSSSTAGAAAASSAYPSLGVGSVLSGASGLLRDVATALDYVFGVFGRGQGWRLVIMLVFAAALWGSYKSLSSAGAVPSGLVPNVPKVVPV